MHGNCQVRAYVYQLEIYNSCPEILFWYLRERFCQVWQLIILYVQPFEENWENWEEEEHDGSVTLPSPVQNTRYYIHSCQQIL